MNEEKKKDLSTQKLHVILELFKTEIETQLKVISEGLLAYQQSKENLKLLEPLMRGAHSIKGAAKVLLFEPIVQLVHVMEDCFISAQERKVILEGNLLEILFQALDCLGSLAKVSPGEIPLTIERDKKKLAHLGEEIRKFLPVKDQSKEIETSIEKQKSIEELVGKKETLEEPYDAIIRLNAKNVNRLMGLAAESMVETRWLQPFCDSLSHLKLIYNKMFTQLDFLKNSLGSSYSEITNAHFLRLSDTMRSFIYEFSDRISNLEMFIMRHSNLTDRLYSEVIESRMRPFEDGIHAFPRMVWETARRLKKRARLEISGKSTLVDRDILEKFEVPLGHLIRNAIDHGIETPEERIAAGKSPEGVICLQASHKAGRLAITVSDDGRGIDLNRLRKKIVQSNLLSEDVATSLNEEKLLNFLFLPGVSTSDNITDLSGRGVGLNIVQNMLQEVSGTIQIENKPGKGASFHLQLPLTLSVVRALITKIDHGFFAFPLSHIEQAISISKTSIEQVENLEYFTYLGLNIGLVPAIQVLNLGDFTSFSHTIPVVIVRHQLNYYGIVVDEFLDEKELVLQNVQSQLKIPCVSSGSVTENGEPILIIDIEEIIKSIDTFLSGHKLYKIQYKVEQLPPPKKRILVVDDSITVREVECRLLKNQGYQVESATNGVEAWNALQAKNYDLIVTDVDMPRMDGIELTRNIKNDARLKALPVLIVSYMEKENEKILGLNAGANYYLTKSTFADESLIKAVIDLIGEPC